MLALLTAPQLSVTDCPAVMDALDAVKVKLFGCPEQLAAAGKGGGTVVLVAVAVVFAAAFVVGFAVAFGDATLITTVMPEPKIVPLLF